MVRCLTERVPWFCRADTRVVIALINESANAGRDSSRPSSLKIAHPTEELVPGMTHRCVDSASMATRGKAPGGSRKWLQILINDHPEILHQHLSEHLNLSAIDTIEWKSPLVTDEYRELRDQAFLDILDTNLETRPLPDFWPRLGPEWDALGRTSRGDVFIVEAKAHIPEMKTPATQAKNHASIELIRQSLAETQRFVRGSDYVDWSEVFYQYTNRIAHLYLLRELNHVPAWLVFVYFVGDTEMGGPKTVDEWNGAIDLLHQVLGLGPRNPLRGFIVDIFVDVNELKG